MICNCPSLSIEVSARQHFIALNLVFRFMPRHDSSVLMLVNVVRAIIILLLISFSDLPSSVSKLSSVSKIVEICLQKPKALAVITNSPKKSARPAVKIATKPIAMPTVPSPSVPATRCLSLKRTPKRLSRKRLEPSSTETSDEKNAEKKNAENCDVQ